MTRPKLPVIMEQAQGRTNYNIVVQQGQGLWAVTYQGQWIGVSRYNRYRDGDRKYWKTAFITPAPAFRLADRLNRLFECQEFEVCYLPEPPLTPE